MLRWSFFTAAVFAGVTLSIDSPFARIIPGVFAVFFIFIPIAILCETVEESALRDVRKRCRSRNCMAGPDRKSWEIICIRCGRIQLSALSRMASCAASLLATFLYLWACLSGLAGLPDTPWTAGRIVAMTVTVIFLGTPALLLIGLSGYLGYRAIVHFFSVIWTEIIALRWAVRESGKRWGNGSLAPATGLDEVE